MTQSPETKIPPAPWDDIPWSQWEDWHWQLANRLTTCEDRVSRGLDRPTVGLESLYAGDAFSLEPQNLARRFRKSS